MSLASYSYRKEHTIKGKLFSNTLGVYTLTGISSLAKLKLYVPLIEIYKNGLYCAEIRRQGCLP